MSESNTLTVPVEAIVNAGTSTSINSGNTTINQTNITVIANAAPVRHTAPVHRSIHHAKPPAHPIAPVAVTPSVLDGTSHPIVNFGNDGDRTTTYLSSDGASATFREDRQNNGAITLTLQDASGRVTTFGDHRGYDAKRMNRNGDSSYEHVAVDGHWGGSYFSHGSDRMECSTATRNVNITPSVADQVTLDKLQRFAVAHPELSEALKHVALPATVAGGRQIDFAEALQRPTNFEGCPANTKDAIRKK